MLGNFYDPSEPTVEADPWIPLLGASYSTNEKGEGKGCFSLFTGFNYQENIGHAVVFTDKSDTPIACGTLETLETTLEGDSIDVFPGYDGSLAPAGSVKADFHEDNSLLLSYDIAGLPANCIECGISIQTGESVFCFPLAICLVVSLSRLCVIEIETSTNLSNYFHRFRCYMRRRWCAPGHYFPTI